MKDRIIESLLADFRNAYNIDSDESNLFEHFVNYCTGSQTIPNEFEFEDISVGGHGEVGLDGIAIIVNDHLVVSQSDVDFFKKSLGRLDVQFVFIQSKTAEKFEASEIAKFFYSVKNFFNRKSHFIQKNEKILQFHAIKEYIYESTKDMEQNPDCSLYYVTTGEWKNDPILGQLIKDHIDELEKTKLFHQIEFVPVDAERLKKTYRALRSKINKIINFEKHTILPSIEKVPTAYIGILPGTEYLKLICDDNGRLDRRLFYDNVRDFQGNNRVNQEIAETIKDTESKGRFVLLNNGITIVAKHINQTGTAFTIRDFQIVNGCQTSHVLYNNRDKLTSEVYLPIKLIVTTNLEVTNSIIQATNSQTEVKREAFESLSPFHKELEEFYQTFDDHDKRLYYERRSRQYESYPGIKREQIVSLAMQLKSFLAMFLNNPHSTHRYYGNILDQEGSQVLMKVMICILTISAVMHFIGLKVYLVSEY